MQRAAPEDWYRVERVGDDVTHISEPFIREFYRCNMWHVRGRDRDLLVDSGMGVVSLRAWVPLVTEKRCLAVASHTHFDHIGAHHEFPDRLVHGAEAELLARPTRAATLVEPYVSDEIFTRLPPEPYRSAAYAVAAAPATRIRDRRRHHRPRRSALRGHPHPGTFTGRIALWEADTATLFSGDIVYDGPLIEDAYHSDPRDYHASMKRLHDLPVRIVHGGHFPSYDGARHRRIIRRWLDEKERA